MIQVSVDSTPRPMLTNDTGINHPAPPSSRERGLSKSRYVTIETRGTGWSKPERPLIHPVPQKVTQFRNRVVFMFRGTGRFTPVNKLTRVWEHVCYETCLSKR